MNADMTADGFAQDAALFARMRTMWAAVDAMPADLIDRMVAAVAVADLTREYALLTLVETDLAAVRGESDTVTVQFSDGTLTVLLHITRTSPLLRRIDGWVDAATATVVLMQEEGGRPVERSIEPDGTGRFAFEAVPAGMSRVRLSVPTPDGGVREFQTPHFEL